MTERWAACIDAREWDSVARLRQVDGAEVCDGASEIWIRGRRLTEEVELLLRKHPHARHYRVLNDGQLVHPQRRVPTHRLPAGPWEPIERWIQIRVPQASFARRHIPRLTLRLVRCSREYELTALHTDLSLWVTWGVTAAEIRLDRLAFAASEGQSVIVRGSPLPPLPGQRFYERDRILVPAGWAWSPALPAAAVRQLLELPRDDFAIWLPTGQVEFIPSTELVAADRSAIRATAAGYGHA